MTDPSPFDSDADADADADENDPPSPPDANSGNGPSTQNGDDLLVDTDALAGLISPVPVPPAFARLTDEAEATIRRNGLTQFYGLRRMWSRWLITWVSVLILFQIVLTFAIGLGLLDYTEYDWFLPLVTAQNFLQIVGMAIVVVRFLHSESKQPNDADRF